VFRNYGSRLRLFFRRHQVVIRSCGIFVAGILLGAFVYSRLVATGLFAIDASYTARATAFFLNLVGCAVRVSGQSITSSSFTVDIGTGCTALIPIMLFICAVLAYPGRLKFKVWGIILGIICLYAINLVRTVSLFYIGSHFYSFFDTVHLLLWQPLIILVAVVLWLFWVRRTGNVPA
jgi:exosortase H (IPTLxxWG-CTERM-specific)